MRAEGHQLSWDPRNPTQKCMLAAGPFPRKASWNTTFMFSLGWLASRPQKRWWKGSRLNANWLQKGWLDSPWVAKSWTGLRDFTFTYGYESWTVKKAEPQRTGSFELWCCIRLLPWRRKWQPTQVFLPGESHGQRSQGVSKSQTWLRTHHVLPPSPASLSLSPPSHSSPTTCSFALQCGQPLLISPWPSQSQDAVSDRTL